MQDFMQESLARKSCMLC